MKRIGIVSDTHIPKVAPSLPARLLKELEGCDLILHAGDLVDLRVIDELEELAPTVAVRGNMDAPEVARSLPETRVIAVEGLRIGLAHGGGAPLGIERRVMSLFSDVGVVVYGHTHQPKVEWKGEVLLVNPGTPTDLRFSSRLSYAVLVVEGGKAEAEIRYLD
ncbi:MAG: metallophosphoesterase [Candidatus Geothermincolales bacterium]